MQYPVTEEQRNALIKAQDNRCLLCGTGYNILRGLVIDHDHETGEIRGALCSACNTGLGLFRDSVPLLYAAIAYLEGYRGIATNESPLPNDPVSICEGSWEHPKHESPHTYRCSVCDRPTGARKTVKMELIRRGEFIVREHYPPGIKPNGRGKRPRIMSAVEAIH